MTEKPSLINAVADQKIQFERHGYFVADWVGQAQGSEPVFNLALGLKDGWRSKFMSNHYATFKQ